MRRLRGVAPWIIVLVMIGLAIAGALFITTSVGRKQTTVVVGSAAIAATLATTDDQQAQGLSDTDSLGAGQGMLFIFQTSGLHLMWMKDMKYNLDIIWLNAAKHVVLIQPNVAPSTYPKTYGDGANAKYVIEVPAGTAKSAGIKRGTLADFQLP